MHAHNLTLTLTHIYIYNTYTYYIYCIVYNTVKYGRGISMKLAAYNRLRYVGLYTLHPPEQVIPSPVNPALQVQMYPPIVLVQKAFWWQEAVPDLHSSYYLEKTANQFSQWMKIIYCTK